MRRSRGFLLFIFSFLTKKNKMTPEETFSLTKHLTANEINSFSFEFLLEAVDLLLKFSLSNSKSDASKVIRCLNCLLEKLDPREMNEIIGDKLKNPVKQVGFGTFRKKLRKKNLSENRRGTALR